MTCSRCAARTPPSGWIWRRRWSGSHRPRGRWSGRLWGWGRTIASSKALMRLRRNKYRETDELQDDVLPLRREDTALRMDLEAALERLSPTSRSVVWLHDVEGRSEERRVGKEGRSRWSP